MATNERIAEIERQIEILDEKIADSDVKMQWRPGDNGLEDERKREYFGDWQDYRRQRASLAAQMRVAKNQKFVEEVRRILAAPPDGDCPEWQEKYRKLQRIDMARSLYADDQAWKECRAIDLSEMPDDAKLAAYREWAAAQPEPVAA